ncbi:unnamed protein product [Trichobilharzia szidati]|nr:unnamed protein product [Trichobilharzia szidati]
MDSSIYCRLIFLLFCPVVSQAYSSFSEDGLVVPVYDSGDTASANCEDTLRAIQQQESQNGRLQEISKEPSEDTPHLFNKTASIPEHYQPIEDGRIVSAYVPKCRPDRPDLYIARQCNEYDCFCVNVTTGETLLGTRASPAEVGDCSTAVYSVLLALRLRSILPSSDSGESRGDAIGMSQDRDASLKLHIRNSLEGILHSAVGFQRVTNITRISTKPNTQDLHGSSDYVYYQVELTSTGHSSLQSPQDLVENRLHEGFLSEVGAVDPSISYVKLIQSKIPDPPPLRSPSSYETLSQNSEYLSDKQTFIHSTKSEMPQTEDQPQPTGHKMVAVRSPEIPDASYINPHEPSSLRSLNSKSSENAAHLVGSFDHNIMRGSGSSSGRQTSIQSRSPHQPWATGTSTSQILSQPGVIAGIVGGVVVVLLLLILLILFCIYRLRKKDEGSYALDEPKKLPTVNTYTRAPTREFYA